MKRPLATALVQRWYAPAPPPVWLRPFAAAFGATVTARRAAYRRRLLRVHRLPIPVLVAGNLTVGGSGKTPFVIWCARLLAAHGFRPAVLSRGHGVRVGRAPLRAGPHDDPLRCGDEPVLIAAETGLPVYVHPDRVRAARTALAAGADVLVCDDGLQHYRLARDIEIVLTDGRRRHGNGALLPAGPLREPAARAAQADFRVCKGGPAQAGEVLMRYTDFALERLHDGARKAVQTCAGTPVHALAGIADPAGFFATLRELGLTVHEHPRPDHHRFRAADLAFDDVAPVIMTGKDAVKCRAFADARCFRLVHAVALPDEFASALLARVRALANGG